MQLLEQVKKGFTPPIKSPAYDSPISGLINACINDLYLAGVNKFKNENIGPSSENDDQMLVHACVLFCKANGYDDDASRYSVSYELFKNSLAISAEYSEVKNG